jgi:hypothetical protein
MRRGSSPTSQGHGPGISSTVSPSALLRRPLVATKKLVHLGGNEVSVVVHRFV